MFKDNSLTKTYESLIIFISLFRNFPSRKLAADLPTVSLSHNCVQ